MGLRRPVICLAIGAGTLLGCSESGTKPNAENQVSMVPVRWDITLDGHGPGVHSIFMIVDVRGVARSDLERLGATLVWNETEIELCTNPDFQGFIGVRSEGYYGEPVLQIGDGFQSTEQGPGCSINADMANTFASYGLPVEACIWVKTAVGDAEYCAPLEVLSSDNGMPINDWNACDGPDGECPVPKFACEDVTEAGLCSDATTVRYCDTIYDNGRIDFSCTIFGGSTFCLEIDGWGADCAVPPGATCELYDPDTMKAYNLFCDGNDAACVWTDGENVTCQTELGLTACDAGTFTPTCEGDIFVHRCSLQRLGGTEYARGLPPLKQTLAADCAGLGGTCFATGCLIAAGGKCDGSIAICDGGLTCNVPRGSRLGTCE